MGCNKLTCKTHKRTETVRDKYHTMDELYEHRNLLFVNFCLQVPDKCAWKRDAQKDWFILYAELESGQVSYHLPGSMIPLVAGKIDESPGYCWDGSGPEDSITRLRKEAQEQR